MESVDAVLRQAAVDLDAGRHQDLTDLGYLIAGSSEADLDEARTAIATIQVRGFNRGQDLPEDLAAIISQARK